MKDDPSRTLLSCMRHSSQLCPKQAGHDEVRYGGLSRSTLDYTEAQNNHNKAFYRIRTTVILLYGLWRYEPCRISRFQRYVLSCT